MAVIINEFEVVPEPPPQQATNTTATPAPAPPQNTLPQQVDSVMRLRYQRAIRVRAD